jgi:GNAT superfamily N-acetyltransferase
VGSARPDLAVVPLDEGHDRGGFSCGVESLDRYLRTQAGQDVRRRANGVFELVAQAHPVQALGYYSLCAAALPPGEVPEAARKHLPRYPLVSAKLIGRLAVAKDRQGQRLGAALLANALRRSLTSAETVGSSMIVVDALDEGAAACYSAHRFVRLPGSLRLVIPMRAAEQLVAEVRERRPGGARTGSSCPGRCERAGRRRSAAVRRHPRGADKATRAYLPVTTVFSAYPTACFPASRATTDIR